MVQDLQRSGYPSIVRHQSTREALARFEMMRQMEDMGGQPTHKFREWQKSVRRWTRRGM